MHVLSSAALAVGACVWLASGVVLSWIDLRERRLPRRIVTPALWVLSCLGVVVLLGTGQWWRGASAAVGAVAMWAVYALLARLGRRTRGVGGGDVHYARVLGLVTGFCGWPAPWLAMAAAFAGGGLWCLWLLAVRRVEPTHRVAFGPFMFLGSVVAVGAAGLG
jgi:leader peptidase (prepilin peptidase)/N-methyltransferase